MGKKITPPEGFSPLVESNDWGTFITLDGTRIEDGEKLQFWFPDGKMHRKKVKVYTSESGMPMRQESNSKYYCTFKLHGTNVSVQLTDQFFARRVD